jgi:hypothetical protein
MVSDNNNLTRSAKKEEHEKDEEDKYKAEIINTAAQLAQKLVRQEMDLIWLRLQDVEAQTEINTKSNANTLGVVRNHVHEPIAKN